MAFRDNPSASPHPFLIWSGISPTVLIYMSPFGPVPTHLSPQAASSPLLLLSALFMVLGVLSVMRLMNYPHRPGPAIQVSCSLSQWWIASCKKRAGRAVSPAEISIYHRCNLQSGKNFVIVSYLLRLAVICFRKWILSLSLRHTVFLPSKSFDHKVPTTYSMSKSNQIDLLVGNLITAIFAIFACTCTLICGLGGILYASKML